MSVGLKFINHFLPNREQASDIYEIPKYEEKTKIEFRNAESLMRHLEENVFVEQSIYWRNINENELNRHGMIFYTKDSHMIFGISQNVHSNSENTENEDQCLAELKDFFDTKEGYITYECPPKYEYREFMKMVDSFNKE